MFRDRIPYGHIHIPISVVVAGASVSIAVAAVRFITPSKNPSSSTTSSGSSERSTEAEACPVPPLCSSSPTPRLRSRPSLACSLMAGTAWLASSMPINASTHLRAAPPPSIYLSTPIGRLLPIQRRPGRCIHPHPPPTPRPSSSPQCRLPASSAPGILELEVGGDVKVAVDDQLSEFCEGRIGGRCVRSTVGERRSERSRARRGRWVMQESGSGRVGIPRARAQGARLITWRSARL